jgi:hypothetical protein
MNAEAKQESAGAEPGDGHAGPVTAYSPMLGRMTLHSPRYIQKNVIKRFSQQHASETVSTNIVLAPDDGESKRIRQFFKIAENRKRQILERMLMD